MHRWICIIYLFIYYSQSPFCIDTKQDTRHKTHVKDKCKKLKHKSKEQKVMSVCVVTQLLIIEAVSLYSYSVTHY